MGVIALLSGSCIAGPECGHTSLRMVKSSSQRQWLDAPLSNFKFTDFGGGTTEVEWITDSNLERWLFLTPTSVPVILNILGRIQ